MVTWIYNKFLFLYGNNVSDYSDSYFQRNHLRHLNSWYAFVFYAYYRFVAYYCMAQVAGIKKKDKILDIGCGVGILVNEFNKLGYKAEGVDVNPQAIGHAIDKNCHLVNTTAKLSYPKSSFDLIVSREVLEHIPPKDIDNCIKEWDRVGKGKMVHIIAVKERGASATDDPTHVNVQTESWWIKKFKEHGYKTKLYPSKLFFSPFGVKGYMLVTK